MPGVASGSWFPTGFHGHFRSHMRNDIYQEYRREARPEPPHVFEKRIKGMGKKKMLNARESYNVLRWVPLEKNLEMQTPLLSTYRMDFWEHGPTTEKMPQLIVPRLSSTSYPGIKINRQLFWSPQSRQNLAIDRTHSKVPEQPTLKDSIPKTAHSRTSSSSLRRIVSSPCKRLTVSDCLNWHSQENINQKNIEKE
ncbi:hypothetical protein XENTR_v10012829 [Xenopus tropicalis]|nr:hypothetical protein XENTR_v10012829 [Xenopus tropicalis]